MLSSCDSTVAVLSGDAATALPIAELAPERAAHVSTRRNFSHTQVHDHLQAYRSGREEGYDVGYAAGLQAAEADIARTASSLQAAIIQFGTNEADLADQLADLATSLAVELATTILDNELKEPADFATYAIRKALSIALPSEPVTITMHPEDAAHVPGMANVEVRENRCFLEVFSCRRHKACQIDPHSLINQVREVLNIEQTSTAPAPASATPETPKETGGENGAPKTTARKTKSASRTSTTRSRKTAAAKTGTSTAAKRRTTASTTAKKPARATKKDTNAA